MKKKEVKKEKVLAEEEEGREGAQRLEILKAVARAWHERSGSHRPMREFDAQRNRSACGCSSSRPSRFKLEAMNRSQEASATAWAFAHSLWDSYELVTLAKKLEAGLVMGHGSLEELSGPCGLALRKPRQSRNSLRSLFNRISSGRYHDDHVKPKDDGPHSDG